MMVTQKKKQTLPDRVKARTLYKRHRSQFDMVVRRLYRKINGILQSAGLKPTIKFRIKDFDSYYDKLNRFYDKGESIVITDLLAMRIICPFLENLEEVEHLLKENFKIHEIERKGEQHSFKEFGYDSTHILIRLPEYALEENMPFAKDVCEVQLRTTLQDAWAEVEHQLVYKSDLKIPNESIKRKLASLNASLTLSDIIFQEIRDFQKEIKEKDERRRKAFHNKIKVMDSDFMSHESDEIVSHTGIVMNGNAKPKNKLEKLILDSLDAHSNQQYDQAISIYSQILSMKCKAPIRSIIYNHRGMAYFLISDFRRAIKDFSKAIQFNEKNYRAFYNRGLGYRVLHRYEASIEDFEEAISHNAMLFDSIYGLAQSWFDLSNYSMALNYCEQVLDLKPDFSPAKQLKKTILQKMIS